VLLYEDAHSLDLSHQTALLSGKNEILRRNRSVLETRQFPSVVIGSLLVAARHSGSFACGGSVQRRIQEGEGVEAPPPLIGSQFFSINRFSHIKAYSSLCASATNDDWADTLFRPSPFQNFWIRHWSVEKKRPKN